jgi:hypothetical protein
MTDLTVNTLRRVEIPPVTLAHAVEDPAVDQEFRRYVRAHFALWPILTACLVWMLAFVFYAFIATRADAAPMPKHGDISQPFSPVACYQLVQDAGRMIAWARWEQGLSLEKARSSGFRAGTPDWMVDLVQTWISDAYQWRATDEQIREWAAELGNVDNLPGADQLSAHQSIAIWLRRTARQCNRERV